MARRSKKGKPTESGSVVGITSLLRELWQAAVTLRGSIEPADYKRYVLPIIFLRFLSLRFERRRNELQSLTRDRGSDYFTDDPKAAKALLTDPDEYRAVGAFLVPEKAQWEYIRARAQADDIKVVLDDALELLETTYPDKLRGLLPRIYAGSHLARESLTGLINLFSKDVFQQEQDGEDLIGRVYEYFIGGFADSEGKRGGEYFTDEVIFYQRVRKQLLKTLPGPTPPPVDVDRAVRDLVDDAVQSEGVVDIFEASGIERPDLSILDDEFLQTFKDKPFPNLRLKLLEKLLRDEIGRRRSRNLAKARSFRELLEETLKKYHNRLIDAAAVVRMILDIRKQMEASEKRAADLGLAEDELAFYDAVAANFEKVYTVEFLRDLVHDVVQAVKRNLKVDWTEPHREDVKAAVRAAVKRVLRSRGVKPEDFDPFVTSIMAQAEALYTGWPVAA